MVRREGEIVLRVLARLSFAAEFALVLFFNILCIDAANAHVKWFCGFDVAAQPRGLEGVLIPDFWLLTGFAFVTFLIGCLVEEMPLGAALSRAINRVTGGLRDNTELLFRVVGGFFFVALWTTGDFILTPELKTTSPAIGWLQLGIAAGLISRRTMPLSALGIVALFAIAVSQYGVFHLADYPIFLGVAAYLALTGLRLDFFGMRPIDVVRWSAAITLMWASIEKWAYPQWTFPLFIEHPTLNLGYDPEYYMRAAGVVEFTLAFALIWTPLVRRCAAIMLIVMFASAALEFGKLDLIGRSLIVVVLLAIVGDDVGQVEAAKLQHYLLVPITYGAALTVFLGIYYGAHAALFGTAIF
jgi:hypothetical protein